MRARGAQATDIAVLVVAADDGVKPQTIEALNHAQAADVPIVVAVNKVDKEGADPDKVRAQLTEYGLVAEEYGGSTMFVDISAKKAPASTSLLEAILLTADAELDLRANPTQDAQGVAIEAHLDKGRGPVATVLVQRGTLRVGDSIVCGEAFGRVRAMLDDNGEQVQEAEPSRPVHGPRSHRGAGRRRQLHRGHRRPDGPPDRPAARGAQAQRRHGASRAVAAPSKSCSRTWRRARSHELKLIIKGDVSGSVEALEDALLKIDVGDEVSLRVLHRAVGAITEYDVNLAIADDERGHHRLQRPARGRARDLAEREGVDIRYYSVIYQAIEEVESGPQGHAQAGVRGGPARHRRGPRGLQGAEDRQRRRLRWSAPARSSATARPGSSATASSSPTTSPSQSLRRFKDDATEVREGFECGIGVGYNDIKIDDVIETFEMREKPRA